MAGLLALAAAGAAAAFSQPPNGTTSRSVADSGNNFFLVLTSQKKTSHTCQATSKKHNTVRKGKLIPTACEQPPRVNISTGSALTKAAAVDALG